MKTPIPKRLPKPTGLDSAEREYLRFLNKYQKTFETLVRQELRNILPDLKDEVAEEVPRAMRADQSEYAEKMAEFPLLTKRARYDANIEKELLELFASVQSRLQSLFPDVMLRRWARLMIGRVNNAGKKNVKKTMEKVNVKVEPLLKDDNLNPFFENVIDENVGLIRSISASRIPTFKNALVSAISEDMSHRDLAKLIQDQFRVTKGKARLLARDQVGKLNGKLNKYRQESLGGQRYIWRSGADRRERPDHRKLNDRTFRWDKPPVVDLRTGRRGHPGDDYQCRCWAEMVLSDVVE